MRERAAGSIQQGMRSIGLGADLQLVDFGELVGQLTATYDWETVVIGFTGGSDPYGGITFWHSDADFHLWYPNQPEPATAWEAEIDDPVHRGQPGTGPPGAGAAVSPGGRR